MQDRIQRSLLAETKLTLDVAYTKARAMETAEKNSKEIQKPQAEEAPMKPLLRVEKQQKGANSPRGKCYRCNESHPNSVCRFKDYTCHKCKRKGHIAKACRNGRQQPWKQQQDAHCMEASEEDSDQEESIQSVILVSCISPHFSLDVIRLVKCNSSNLQPKGDATRVDFTTCSARNHLHRSSPTFQYKASIIGCSTEINLFIKANA